MIPTYEAASRPDRLPTIVRAELPELTRIAIEAANRGATVVRGALGSIRRGAVATKSSASDWVTEIDKRAEAAILGFLHDRRPDDDVLAEESGASPASAGSRDWQWVVDPLDGTVNFVYDYPAFAVAVGLTWQGRPVVGVVIDVSRDETYCGQLGAASTRNGMPIACSDVTALADALIGTGFSYRQEWRAQQARVVAAVLTAAKDIRRSGSAALDICHVADGRLDAFYESGIQPWDHTAAEVVALGAGAVVGGAAFGAHPSKKLTWVSAPGISDVFSHFIWGAGAPLSDLE